MLEFVVPLLVSLAAVPVRLAGALGTGTDRVINRVVPLCAGRVVHRSPPRRLVTSRRCDRYVPFVTTLFLAVLLSAQADTSVTFNEVMYHPATNEPTMEWLELYNQMAVDVDISGWALDGGVHYCFPSNSIVPGGGYLLVALAPEAVKSAWGLASVYGPWTNRLGNGGDTLRLRNNSGRVVDELSYEVGGEWPVAPDGSGVSLAKREAQTASGPAANWGFSNQVGGSPGAENFPTLGTAVVTSLVTMTAAWKYDGSGTDLGTGWRQPAYDDTLWSAWAPFTNRSIPTLFSTGVGASGAALAAGSQDPHYVLSAAAQGTVGAPATVIQNHSAWVANDAVSSWIGVLNPGTTSVSQGAYNYQTTFSLAGFLLSSVQLSMRVAVDNDVTNVLLNGVSTDLAYSGYASFSSAFKLTSGFRSDLNTLEFCTVNASASANPHGFRALVSGSGLAADTNQAPAAGRVTYYLRKSFQFSGDPARTQLKLNPLVADGAVVFLNGAEVYRVNLPGTSGYSTPAQTNVTALAPRGWMEVPADSLVSGVNVLAVELHQAADGTDGPLFGVELTATALPVANVPLAFNELSTATNGEFWLELMNLGATNMSLAGLVLACDGATNAEFVFPSGAVLAAGQCLALTDAALGFRPASGDKLHLYSANRHRVFDSVSLTKGARARWPNGCGEWLVPTMPTPGVTNSFTFHPEIVINEILYHAPPVQGDTNLPPQASDEAWIELFNRGTNGVDLTGWRLEGGIRFAFPPGQSMAPGAYLVIAKDAASLRTKYPAIEILGNFSGGLSHRGDRIVLKDALGNPANAVTYFTSGHWPAYADGGGSSLELRDPYADNSKPEAWADSDESSKSSWQTFRYQGVAQTVVGANQWNDFILGLLSDGECLVDDVSVVQSPSTSPLAFVANGNFENGLAGWRVLGNHAGTRVETDPTNAANHVLHVVATGPQEHMHNHIETTYTAGRTVANGLTYEISFRAKWIAGNNLLNTRLYFDRVALTTTLPRPTRIGTPGGRNSRYVANLGPTFSQFRHLPVVPQPGEAVTVSVRAEDPQGVATCEVWWSSNGAALLHAGMAPQTDGMYQGTIPAYPAGTVVQFFVRAVDRLGAAATFPPRGAGAGALYAVGDGQADLTLGHNLRLILTPANRALLHADTNVMSNALVPGTLIYDEQRAYYDIGLRLKSSERGRSVDARVSFHVEFQPDELFRGVHPVMLIDRSGAQPIAANKQEEILLRHMLLHAGDIPGPQPDLCRVIAPYATHTGPAILSPRHEDEFVESAFANGGDGTEWELELIYYPTTTNAYGYKLPQPDTVVNKDISDLGNDKELYRYHFILKNHRDIDDYRPFIAFAKTFSLAAGAQLDSATRQVMDVDQWLRAFALISLCGVTDSYTFGNNHNLLIYLRPSDQRMLAFPWDMDYAPTRDASSALIGDQNWGKIESLPGNKRRFYAHVLDIIGSTYNTSYMSYWVAHYARFCPGQDYSTLLTYITARTTAARAEINAAGGNAAFALTSSSSFTSSSNLVYLAGTAPVQVQSILVNGVAYAVTWSSVSNWTMAVPLSAPTNVLNLVGCDLSGNVLTNYARTATIRYTGAAPNPVGSVVFNEILCQAPTNGSEFIELRNTSSTMSFDLSGWRINGADYVFPSGSVLTNRQLLVLAKDRLRYAGTYGTTASVFDEYSGNLQSEGETLTLLMPGPQTNQEAVVDQVRYETVAPWPSPKAGVSLQVVDGAQDNSRVANWAAGATNRPVVPQWVYFTTNGTASDPRFYVYLASAGDVYVDDLRLVLGTDPGSGTNLLANPGFELPLANGWTTSANFALSTQSTNVWHSGGASLHLVATAPGSGNTNSVYQVVSNLTSGQSCALSFWYLQSTNANSLIVRLSGSSLTSGSVNPAPASTTSAVATPGTSNSVGAILPPFPPLWLNEVQAENLSGPADNVGEREAWVELYNAGTNALSLAGYYLSDNYSNLMVWPFPTNAVVPASGFGLVWCDGQVSQSSSTNWHASFRLPVGHGAVALSRFTNSTVQLLDYLNYTNLPANWSYGAVPDGQPFYRDRMFYSTPLTTNNPASPPIAVVINEWMADNSATLTDPADNDSEDWFEIFNPRTNSVDLGGCYLTDTLTNRFQFRIPDNGHYVVPARGFLLVWADGEPKQNSTNRPDLHADFKLDKAGEVIGLFAPDGTTIDVVTFGPQGSDVSQGRYPDGGLTLFSMSHPSPRAANVMPNTAPVLGAIPDRYVHAGQTLQFIAKATDAESAFQRLTFSLVGGAPEGAALDALSGRFTWNVAGVPVPSVYTITIRVADDGGLSDETSFAVRVEPRPQLASAGLNGSMLRLSFGALPGQTYQVQCKEQLSDAAWLPFSAALIGTGDVQSVEADLTGQPQRFFRVICLEQPE